MSQAHKCKVILVGLKNDIRKEKLNIDPTFWQKEWPKLLIHDSVFRTTSKGWNDRMEKLLSEIKNECMTIMEKCCSDIPICYQVLLDDLGKQNKLVLSRRYIQFVFVLSTFLGTCPGAYNYSLCFAIWNSLNLIWVC